MPTTWVIDEATLVSGNVVVTTSVSEVATAGSELTTVEDIVVSITVAFVVNFVEIVVAVVVSVVVDSVDVDAVIEDGFKVVVTTVVVVVVGVVVEVVVVAVVVVEVVVVEVEGMDVVVAVTIEPFYQEQFSIRKSNPNLYSVLYPLIRHVLLCFSV